VTSNPILKKLATAIDAVGGEDAVCDMLADNMTIKQVMSQFPVEKEEGAEPVVLSNSMFYRWRDRGGPSRRAKIEEAMKMRAETIMEEGMEIVDDVAGAEKMPTVVAAKNRADYRKAFAALLDKERYGTKQEGVQVHIGRLHLDALRQAGAPNAQLEGDIPELLEEGESDPGE